MLPEKILQADVLDILFDTREKSYGAYQLRKQYDRRLSIALGVMFCVALLFSLSTLWAGNGRGRIEALPMRDVIISDDLKKPPPKIELPKPKPAPKLEVMKFTPPVLVHETLKSRRRNRQNWMKRISARSIRRVRKTPV